VINYGPEVRATRQGQKVLVAK